ncbi:MAG: PDZ domain-containing protein [Armatimonadetes bacterium]|nr:PDZ domain-containing protein [Armatimonadota bacterium]
MRTQRSFWLAATVTSLMAVSFLSGLGLRRLYSLVVRPDLLSSLRFASTSTGDPDLRPSTLYYEALRRLEAYYVEPLPADKTAMANGAIEGMLALLDDPNTRLLAPREWEALQEAGEGHFRGLGAQMMIRKLKPADHGVERALMVVSVMPGSPAEKAGLMSGDRITYVGGKWVLDRHLSQRELLALTDGLEQENTPPNTPASPEDEKRRQQREQAEQMRRRLLNHIEIGAAMVLLSTGEGPQELTVERSGEAKPLTLKVTLGTTEVTPIEERRINGTTGYVRLLILNDATAKALEKILATYATQGVKNLVLDLRQSPGGKLQAAVQIASLLISDGTMAILKERDKDRKEVLRPLRTRGSRPGIRPAGLTVMVDGGTTGASELLAAALRDNLGVQLVGSKTFGDGTLQEIVELDNGSALSITRAYVLTAKARASYDGRGLTPNGPAAAGQEGIAAAVRALAPLPRPSARPRRPA